MAEHRCWAEIDLSAIRHNAEVAQEFAGSDKKLMAIVKADAYGHGVLEVARTLAPYVNMFGVANVQEALEIQQAELSPAPKIFLLGTLLPGERIMAIENGLNNRDALIQRHGPNFPGIDLSSYLKYNIKYRLDDSYIDGMNTFLSKLRELEKLSYKTA